MTPHRTLLALACASLLGGAARAQTEAVLTDIGSANPVPNADDIAQLEITGYSNRPDGLNYYIDNGNPPGQTFTTGGNVQGYTLDSLAIRTAGGGGGNVTQPQAYRLRLYSLNGATATLVGDFISPADFAFTELNWLQWTGLPLVLAANTTYAYTFARVTTGWESLYNAGGNLYAGGELALIPPAGGAVTFGASHAFDATFHVGLTANTADVAPQITAQPVSLSRYAGRSAAFSATASGAPLNYQWKAGAVGSGTYTNLVDGAVFTGTKTPSLALATLVAGNTADYVLEVSNGAGTVLSEPATLTVLTRPAAPVAGPSFGHKVLTNGVHAYWRLDEASSVTEAYDYAGPRDGSYGVSASHGQDAGIVGPQPPDFLGFPADNGALSTVRNLDGAYVTVPALNLNTNTVTFLAWINPSVSQATYTGLIMTRANGTLGGLGYGGGDNELGYTWNSNTTWSWASGLKIPVGEWSLVAVAISPSNAVAYVANPSGGLRSATNSIAHTNEIWAGTARLGGDPDNINRTFDGSFDEAAVFTKTLSHAEILDLYAAGRSAGALPPVIGSQPAPQRLYQGRDLRLSVAATGSGTLSYQWTKGGSPLANSARISGAQTASLVISNVVVGDAGDYAVTVSNPAGSTPSAAATVEIIQPTGEAYEAAMIAAQPYAYYRLNESAGPVLFDQYGGRTGAYGDAAQVGVDGPVVAGLAAGNKAMLTTVSTPGSWATVPSLNLNTNAVTFTAWINSANVQSPAAGLIYQRAVGTVSGLTFNNTGTGLGYNWADNAATYNWNSGLDVPVGEWAFVALVVEASRATLYLGTNQVLVNAVNPVTNAVQAFAGTTYIGNDVFDANGLRIFSGSIDEVGIFNRALNGTEIAALFASGTGQAVAPAVTLTEAPRTVFTGTALAPITGYAAGSPTLAYQWLKDGVALTDGATYGGTTTPTLVFNAAATPAMSGDYALRVTNARGPATSAAVAIRITDPSGYDQSILALQPHSYWNLNETTGTRATDLVGGRHGTYNAAAVIGQPGVPNPPFIGIEANSTSLETANAVVDAHATLPFGSISTNTATFALWVNRTAEAPAYSGLLMTRGGGVEGGLGFGGTANTLGYTWNNNTTWNWNSGLVLPQDIWSLVVLVVTPTNAAIHLLNENGHVSATNTVAHTSDVFGNNWRLGGDAAGDARTFTGRFDNVAVFRQSLTVSQIEQLYAAARNGAAPQIEVNIAPVTGGKLRLTWPQGSLQEATGVTGPWNPVNGAVSPHEVTPTGDARFYRVLIQ